MLLPEPAGLMAKDTLKQIAEYKTRLAALEKKLHGELAKLPARFGFKSADEFLAAFRAATGSKAAARAPKAATGRKARVEITPAIVAKVKELVAGGKTGGDIAESVGISLPSVQNIKRKLGLVKKRG